MRLPSLLLLSLASGLSAQNWSQLRPVATPLARLGASAVTQPGVTRGLLMHGGSNGLSGAVGDTWNFDGTRWRRLTLFGPNRSQAAMAYDSTRNEAVLFGGWSLNPNDTQSDTQIFDSATQTWSLGEAGSNPGTTSPSADRGIAMTYAANVSRTLLFGGYDNRLRTALDASWEWDGSTWTRVTTIGSPPATLNPALAYSPLLDGCLMFGGETSGSVDDTTWFYEPRTTIWRRVQTANRPPARSHGKLIHDPQSNNLVLVGGKDVANGTSFTDTWVFNGNDWCEVFPASNSPDRTLDGDPAVAYLQNIGIVHFGGTTSSGYATADTWVYGGAGGFFCSYGTGCTGAAGLPELQPQTGSTPSPGTSFDVDVINAAGSNAAMLILLGSGPVASANLSSIGAPRCTLYLPGGAVASIGMPLTGGQGTVSLAIPTAPTLDGLSFLMQAAMIDSSVGPLPLSLSNAGLATIR